MTRAQAPAASQEAHKQEAGSPLTVWPGLEPSTLTHDAGVPRSNLIHFSEHLSPTSASVHQVWWKIQKQTKDVLVAFRRFAIYCERLGKNININKRKFSLSYL